VLKVSPHFSDESDVTSRASNYPIATQDRSFCSRFVARQPIFDAHEKVYGYELLFRDGFENFSRFQDPDQAARTTVDTSLLIGLDVLCGASRAFLNCTADSLSCGYLELFLPSQVVVEVLESVESTPAVVAACRHLKEKGYVIALDDFVDNGTRPALVELADILKVDLRAVSLTECVSLVHKYSPRLTLLAEKVETRREFTTAREMGFSLFQGYFFQKPSVISEREIPPQKVQHLRVLQAVHADPFNIREVERHIKQDAALCYRLLRYLNSPLFGFANGIRSVRHALAVLGEVELRRWVSLVTTVGFGASVSTELVATALIRARFCELLSPRLPGPKPDLFLLGLLSLMDAMLEMPMASVLERLPVDIEIKSVLLGQTSKLRPVFQLMLAQESGEWQANEELAARLNLDENFVSGCYWAAVEWARQVHTE
jgi:EAL and modified HD-GYP domain-containing signal transduction protein